MAAEQPRTCAVVGTPNTGKSTLFNALTGLQQRVGNFTGVTVEPMVGRISLMAGKASLIDLPGMYSMDAESEDERLAADVLRGQHPSIPRPDVILFVVNATELDRSLALFAQIAALGLPTLVVATMIDEVKAAGGMFDDIGLHHTLGVPVFGVVGTKGLGIGEVKDAIVDSTVATIPLPVAVATADAVSRMEWARTVARNVVPQLERPALTRRLDAVLLHPVWGGVVFVVVMALFFQSIFTWAEPLMDLIEGGIGFIQQGLIDSMSDNVLRSFLVKGLLGGVGNVLVFLPQILILNLLVIILEECGYLARAAFIVDRLMGLFGLQGRSFIPLLGSFACAIPGIMSARIIPSYRDRMATILATPLMTCSARLPVYALLIGAVIPASTVWGMFSLQSVVLAGLYAAGAISGLLVALVMRKTLFRGGVVSFLMELPPYRFPSVQSVMVGMVGRSKDFLKTAGTVILAFSIGLWILTELPRTDVVGITDPIEADRVQLEQSYAASLGKAVQPLFEPLGFDWRLTLGVLGSYAARETFVGVMGQIYAADVTESDATLRDVLRGTLPLATGLALLAFYVYALQCVSTMAIMKRETGSWRWPAIAFAITFVMAWTSAWVTKLLAT